MQKELQKNFEFNLILIQDFIGAFSFFAPQALLIGYFHNVLHLAPSQLSTALFIMIFFSRVGRVFFAPFLSKINVAMLLLILQLLGGIGFYLFTKVDSPGEIYIGSFLVGLFYGNNAIVVRIATSFLRTSSLNLKYSLLSTVTNIASSGGAAILSFIFYKYNADAMLYLMAILLIASSWFTYWSAKKLVFPKQGGFIKNCYSLIKNKVILLNLVIVMLLWFLYSFSMTYLPLYTIDALHKPGYTWMVTSVNGLIALSLSYPLTWLLKNYRDKFNIVVAFALYAIVALMFIFKASEIVFFATLIIISFAEIISVPAYQNSLAKNTKEHERFAGFSLLILFVGLGESLGSMLAVFMNSHINLIPVFALFSLVIFIFINFFTFPKEAK